MMKLLLVLSLASASALKLQNQKPVAPVLKLRGGFDISSASDLNLLSMLYYGGFGVTLYADPERFYGQGGIVPYDATPPTTVGTFRGRVRVSSFDPPASGSSHPRCPLCLSRLLI